MDQPKVERMLRIMMLLTSNTSETVNAIAEKLETSVRTIYRYIDTFRSAGFVIKNNDGIYRIDKSSPYFKDISELVHFSQEEAFILKQSIDNISDANVITRNLKMKLATVYDYKILADITGDRQIGQNIENLSKAIYEQRQVRLVDYSSANSNSVTTRMVEPFKFTTNFVQVWCYEVKTATNKLFKVARIGEVEVLETWQFEEKHKEGCIDLFRMNSDQSISVKLKLTLRAANLLREEYPLSAEQLAKIDDNRWILETNVCNFEGVGRFIMGLYDEVEIVDSPELKEYINSRIMCMVHG